MDKPVRESEPTHLTPKSIAGRFRIVRELGRGGAGVVYEGVQLSVDRRVAIKVLHADHQAKEDHVERFTREAKAIARLSHTNCITLFDFGFSEEFRAHYMVMEYIEGEELFAITKQRKLPFKTALRVSIQLAEAIAHAHKHGILHRDLKPENVLVTADWDVKVLDFGLARLLDLFAADGGGRRLTAEGAIFGTPAYMSPEQCAGDLDVTVRSDIYSLGIVMYELFEGRLPFAAKEVVKILVQQAKDPPPPMVADIPADVKQLVMQMLAKDPQARPRTGTQVADRLRAVLINIAGEGHELSADISQEIQRSLLRGIDRTDQTGEGIRITEDGLETRTEPIEVDVEVEFEARARTATRDLTGQTLRGYALGPLLGKGPNGSVFAATNPSGQAVAVRVLTREIPEATRNSEAFARQISALQRLRGPTIASLLDAGQEPSVGRYLLTTELVDGDDLQTICDAGRAPTELAFNVACDVATALVEAHSHGVVHRGLKPTNVVLVPDSEGRPHAKVLDFGISELGAQPDRLTHDALSPNALRYVSPEQLRGEVATPAADVYALGVILYQMLCGNPPFDARSHTDLATQILSSAAPPLSEFVREVPQPLSDLVSQLLDKSPARRPTTSQVLAKLEELQDHIPARDIRVDHRGKSSDAATAWRLRRSVLAPTPGPAAPVRPTAQGLQAIQREVAPPRAGAIALIIAVVCAAVAAAIMAFGGSP